MAVDLGFVESAESWLLESRFFRSKVGGKPAWLYLKCIPGAKELECDYCRKPCIFLCQVYSPYEESDSAFHRTIFVFICKDPECCRPNENGNIKIFRSQLGRFNEFYPSEPPIEQIDWRTDISMQTTLLSELHCIAECMSRLFSEAEKWVKTCRICGIWAPNHCAKCKIVNYCCRDHQIFDWKHGHKESCGTNSVQGDQTFLFPEYEVVLKIEDEDSDTSSSEEEDETEIEKYNEMVETGKAGVFQSEDVQKDLLRMANNQEDETFSKFRSVIAKASDQVLRYSRGGEILYISSENQVKDIPRCSECDGERQFEFQIMPQLLNYLKFGNALTSIDWGILAVFTCAKSCIPKNGYSSEYVWKQDIL